MEYTPHWQNALLAGLVRNVEPHSLIQDMVAAPEHRWDVPGTGLPLENASCYAHFASQEEKPPVIPPFCSSVMPITIPTESSVDPSFTSPATTTIMSSSPLSSSSRASSLGDHLSPCSWYDPYSAMPNGAAQGPYSMAMGHAPGEDYHNSCSPHGIGIGTFNGNFVTPPGLDAGAPTTEVIDVKPGQHYGFQWNISTDHPVLKKPKYIQSTVQIVGQGVPDRRFTCTIDNCGKDFSGEWEKTRHINSIHRPPTIGCRECNYKQSRKDLFSEHCRKRHPGESVEKLMVPL